MSGEEEVTGAELQHNTGGSSETAPVVSGRVEFGALEEEYRDAPGFLAGLRRVRRRYKCMRRVRGDGNCFYRALLFAYVEALSAGLRNEAAPSAVEAARRELDRILALVRGCPSQLAAVGYDEFTFEIFHEMFLELLTSLPRVVPSSSSYDREREQDDKNDKEEDGWLDEFCADANADYYTWFMRLLTACSLKQHSERFLPFIEASSPAALGLGGGSEEGMRAFCAREVEPMGVECEHVQIAALTELIGVRVDIEYLDGRIRGEEDTNTCISFPQTDDTTNNSTSNSSSTSANAHDSFPPVKLLYRPGHYDILYPID